MFNALHDAILEEKIESLRQKLAKSEEETQKRIYHLEQSLESVTERLKVLHEQIEHHEMLLEKIAKKGGI